MKRKKQEKLNFISPPAPAHVVPGRKLCITALAADAEHIKELMADLKPILKKYNVASATTFNFLTTPFGPYDIYNPYYSCLDEVAGHSSNIYRWFKDVWYREVESRKLPHRIRWIPVNDLSPDDLPCLDEQVVLRSTDGHEIVGTFTKDGAHTLGGVIFKNLSEVGRCEAELNGAWLSYRELPAWAADADKAVRLELRCGYLGLPISYEGRKPQ